MIIVDASLAVCKPIQNTVKWTEQLAGECCRQVTKFRGIEVYAVLGQQQIRAHVACKVLTL